MQTIEEALADSRRKGVFLFVNHGPWEMGVATTKDFRGCLYTGGL